jgi:hypothetical protein
VYYCAGASGKYPPNMQNLPKVRVFTDFLVRNLGEATRP